MSQEILVDQLFETLISGDRESARRFVSDALSRGMTAENLIGEVFWPTYENLEKLFRHDQLTTIAHHMATRLLRVLVDRLSVEIYAFGGERFHAGYHSPQQGDDRQSVHFVGGKGRVNTLEARELASAWGPN